MLEQQKRQRKRWRLRQPSLLRRKQRRKRQLARRREQVQSQPEQRLQRDLFGNKKGGKEI